MAKQNVFLASHIRGNHSRFEVVIKIVVQVARRKNFEKLFCDAVFGLFESLFNLRKNAHFLILLDVFYGVCEFNADNRRNADFLHRYAVQNVRAFHSRFLVGYDDELRVVGITFEIFGK